MRINGHNVLAIIVAAIVIYAIEFVIFAVMIPADAYFSLIGMTREQSEAIGMARMPYGVIPPILAAIGLSLVIKWRGAAGWVGGAMTGLLMAVFFAFGVCLYSYVYGPHTEQFVAINLGHFLVCYAAAGAVLGAWK